MTDTITYITTAPFFWWGIGMTISCAIFLGATMYNGDLEKLTKGLIGVGFYAFFLFAITAARIYDIGVREGFQDITKAHAGLFTWYLVTAAYIFGLILGVLVVKSLHIKNHDY